MSADGAGGLTASFRRLIENTGPISLTHFMGEANARYYAAADPLGRAGDFVTAPEVSQMFGELIGLWMADIWIRAGRDETAHYVELGPGRGTLARDALRAMKRYGLEPDVHLVETSTALRAAQLEAVPGAILHHDLSTVPLYGSLLVVGNEFLDALPIRQLVRTEDGWRERMVGIAGDRFVPLAGTRPMDSAVPEDRRTAPTGTIVETCPAAAAIVYELAGRLTEQDGAALLIDYGSAEVRDGSTLQAVSRHQKVDPFVQPGTVDLSAHVDFATLAAVAQSRGARWQGTITQGDWLRALGIEARAEALSQFAPHYADEIAGALDRLIAPGEMGELFKVMAIGAPDWPQGAGFT